MALIQFTRNYHDESTDTGFQFEFYCDRCGNGYQTEFQASGLGTVTNALDVASNLFGGFFGMLPTLPGTSVPRPGRRHMTMLLLRPWRRPSLISTSGSAVALGGR